MCWFLLNLTKSFKNFSKWFVVNCRHRFQQRSTRFVSYFWSTKYDDYRGSCGLCEKTNFDGTLKVGNKIRMIRAGRNFIVSKLTWKNLIGRRSVRSAHESRVLTMSMSAILLRLMTRSPAEEALSGYVKPKQIVVGDFYPSSADAETSTGKKHSQTLRSRRRCRFFLWVASCAELQLCRPRQRSNISLIWQMQRNSIFTHTPADLPDPSQIAAIR